MNDATSLSRLHRGMEQQRLLGSTKIKTSPLPKLMGSAPNLTLGAMKEGFLEEETVLKKQKKSVGQTKGEGFPDTGIVYLGIAVTTWHVLGSRD